MVNNRYVTIPSDLRSINYVQLTDANGKCLIPLSNNMTEGTFEISHKSKYYFN